jgi:hypothetical protein
MTSPFRTPAFVLCLFLLSVAAHGSARACATETRRLVGVVADVADTSDPGTQRRRVTVEYDTPDGTHTYQFTRHVRCQSASGGYSLGEYVELEVNATGQVVWLDRQSRPSSAEG